MSQPESTERCDVCGREKWFIGSDHADACEREQENATVLDKFECYYVGYELKVRALAEAETLKRISDSQAHEAWIERDGALARLAEAEKERDELVRDFLDYKIATRAAEERAARLELEARASSACIEFDPPSDPEQIIARLRLVVENHNKQCGDFVSQRNSAWRRAIELGKAKRAAEERAAQAERLFWMYGQHSATCRQSPGGNGPCTCAFTEAWAALHTGRAEPRAAASEAIDSKAVNAGGGAQGEEK